MKPDQVAHMLADIRERIIQPPVNEIPNPALLPSYFDALLREVGQVATDGRVLDGDRKNWIVPPAQEWAERLLQDLWHRACSGVPASEPLDDGWPEPTLRDRWDMDDDERREY
jgi:hypothetical protein